MRHQDGLCEPYAVVLLRVQVVEREDAREELHVHRRLISAVKLERARVVRRWKRVVEAMSIHCKDAKRHGLGRDIALVEGRVATAVGQLVIPARRLGPAAQRLVDEDLALAVRRDRVLRHRGAKCASQPGAAVIPPPSTAANTHASSTPLSLRAGRWRSRQPGRPQV